MKITTRQITYITYLLENRMPDVFSQLPQNNSQHSDTRADYRRLILEDRIKNFTSNTANEIIMAIQKNNKQEVKILIN